MMNEKCVFQNRKLKEVFVIFMMAREEDEEVFKNPRVM